MGKENLINKIVEEATRLYFEGDSAKTAFIKAKKKYNWKGKNGAY